MRGRAEEEGVQRIIADNGNWIFVVLDYVLRNLPKNKSCSLRSVCVIIAGILGFVARHFANLSTAATSNQTTLLSEGTLHFCLG